MGKQTNPNDPNLEIAEVLASLSQDIHKQLVEVNCSFALFAFTQASNVVGVEMTFLSNVVDEDILAKYLVEWAERRSLESDLIGPDPDPDSDPEEPDEGL